MEQDAYEYINAVTDDRRGLYSEFEAMLMEMYPNAKVKKSYGIVMYHSGTGKVWLGYRKDGVSLYTGGPELIEAFHAEYPRFKTGRGCIQFKPGDEIPWERIRELVEKFMGCAVSG